VVVNQGKVNGLFPIEQALSQRVQGVKDSRVRVKCLKKKDSRNQGFKGSSEMLKKKGVEDSRVQEK
jgi:hypothetical protein